jgi:hypothetical protein
MGPLRRLLIMRKLLVSRSFVHYSQSILAAVHRVALVGVELCLNLDILELSVAALAHADGRGGLFHDPQLALRHV